jgi:hypothetical protein
MNKGLFEFLLNENNLNYYLHHMAKNVEKHECVFEETDCDICRDCKEHAAFCETCGSECCGARAYMPD